MRDRSLDHVDSYLSVRVLRTPDAHTRLDARGDVRDLDAARPRADVLTASVFTRRPRFGFQVRRIKHASRSSNRYTTAPIMLAPPLPRAQ
jgi:hypothetical protein